MNLGGFSCSPLESVENDLSRFVSKILENELALVSSSHKVTIIVAFHVIPSEARNPYDSTSSYAPS